MRFIVASMSLLLVVAVGCAGNKKTDSSLTKSPSALDIAPLPPSTPAYQPVTVAAGPAPVITETPTIASAPATPALSSGGNYKVKKGDTLTKISRARYGDATHVKQILAANPSIKNANDIKPGQQIALP